MLTIKKTKYYKVKNGQSLSDVARAFCVSARVLAKANGLSEELQKGQILRIPESAGNAYTATATDTPALLCGSGEKFIEKNGGAYLYPGMRVIL
ncbi:MAG: LysM peptidoglycan-binding domain-containing protein [Clostridiales bacterium]|nr:LysM peptidoglycan-binding domain-containing protein [Clostridiales bacterium]